MALPDPGASFGPAGMIDLRRVVTACAAADLGGSAAPIASRRTPG
jgi:hypothetical protein